MAIPEGHKANFHTLLQAVRDGNVLLAECTDRQTGKPVYVVCAVQSIVDQDSLEPKIEMVPLAQLFDGDPYELVDPPTTKS